MGHYIHKHLHTKCTIWNSSNAFFMKTIHFSSFSVVMKHNMEHFSHFITVVPLFIILMVLMIHTNTEKNCLNK